MHAGTPHAPHRFAPRARQRRRSLGRRAPGGLVLAIAAAAAGAAGAAGAADAQIVNVQPLIAGEEKTGVSGALEGSGDWRTGNTRLLHLSGGLMTTYRSAPHLVFLLVRRELGVQGGNRFLSRDFEHLRYRLRLLPAVHLETFAQHDRDEFRRLALRVLWGGGPRFPVAASRGFDLSVGVAYMLEFERLRQDAQPDAGQETLAHRISSYVVVGARLSDRLRFGETAYLQPRLGRLRDTRALSEAELLVVITRRLALRFTLAAAYDAEPPAGLHALDTATRGSFQLGF